MPRYFRFYILVPLILQIIAWIPTRILLHLFANFKVYGLENIKGLNGPIIFAANHTNELDPILVTAALPLFSRFAPLFYLARESEYYDDKVFGWRRYIYGGLFFKAWGAYPVHSGLRDYEMALQNHIAILRDGGSICIFPEGKMSHDIKSQRAHGGVSYLYNVTKATIVPTKIYVSPNINAGNFLLKKSSIVLWFGPHHNPKSIPKIQRTEWFKRDAQSILDEIYNLQ